MFFITCADSIMHKYLWTVHVSLYDLQLRSWHPYTILTLNNKAMRRNLTLTIFCGLFLMLVACEEEGTSHSDTQQLTLREFLEKTANTYYLDSKSYICSDSLGKVCFWDEDGEPFYGIDSFTDIPDTLLHKYGQPGGRLLYKFNKDYCNVYRQKSLEYDYSGPTYYPEMTRFAWKQYWCYDETDGTFGISYRSVTADDVRKVMWEWNEIRTGTLMEITEKYMTVKFCPASIPSWVKKPNASQTYSLTVFRVVKDEEATQWWCVDAPDANIEMGGTNWEQALKE